jgi:hypothetical protein
VDEFGFDRIEREECPQAAYLLDKVIARRQKRSTILITNVDFEPRRRISATRRSPWPCSIASSTARSSSEQRRFHVPRVERCACRE